MKQQAYRLGISYRATKTVDGCVIRINAQAQAAGNEFIQYLIPETGDILLKRVTPVDLRDYVHFNSYDK